MSKPYRILGPGGAPRHALAFQEIYDACRAYLGEPAPGDLWISVLPDPAVPFLVWVRFDPKQVSR